MHQKLLGDQALEGEPPRLLANLHARATPGLARQDGLQGLGRAVEALEAEALLGGVRQDVYQGLPRRRTSGLALPAGHRGLGANLDVQHPQRAVSVSQVPQQHESSRLALQLACLRALAPGGQNPAILHGPPVQEPVLCAQGTEQLIEAKLVDRPREVLRDPVVVAPAPSVALGAWRSDIPCLEESSGPSRAARRDRGREETLGHWREGDALDLLLQPFLVLATRVAGIILGAAAAILRATAKQPIQHNGCGSSTSHVSPNNTAAT
mmetsp:Transcript_92571/g.299310  ORF Transcript_92571/g.299310 Transcript_92571/m.299310 type:complete len:266 (+) Transcript_92571:1186-1983(+)